MTGTGHGERQPAAPGEGSDFIAADEIARLRTGLEFMVRRALGASAGAEDAVQEVLTRALAALKDGRLKDRTKLGAFVASIARHVMADVLRARGRVIALDELPSSVQPRTIDDPLAVLIQESERAQVRAALRKLAYKDREILRLCYFEGLTPSELAQRLGEPAARIRKRKSRALERLRRVFLD